VSIDPPPAAGQNVTVNYAATTASTATGGGVDYTLASGTLNFSGSNTSHTIPLTITNDGQAESDETVVVSLTGLTGGAILGSVNTYTYTIVDDDRQIVFVNKSLASGDNTGSSWSNALRGNDALDRALDLAESRNPTAGNEVEIWVAKSNEGQPYIPSEMSTPNVPRTKTFKLRPYVLLYGGFNGTTETNIGQRNFTINETVISGDIDENGNSIENCYHLVTGAEGSLLDGFTITGGNNDNVNGYGGGVWASGISMGFANCQFSGNMCSKEGAGMYLVNGTFTIAGCTFKDNIAGSTELTNCAGMGGGLYYEATTISQSLTINNSIFKLNKCLRDQQTSYYPTGGAILVSGNGDVSISNSTFDQNSADAGSAINILDIKCSISDCRFVHNFPSEEFSSEGGAVRIFSPHTCIIERTAFLNNGGVNSCGGAISAQTGENYISNCVFLNNRGGKGAAVYVKVGNSTITNSTFSGNNSTLSGTIAPDDQSYGPVNLNVFNCIMWENICQFTGCERDICTIRPNNELTLTVKASDIQQSGFSGQNGNISVNPFFLDPIPDMETDVQLQSTSACINAGNNILIPTGTDKDLAGNARIQNATVDIGAYEQ
jgi:hypothetical protein